MNVTIDTSSVESYRQFLAIKRLPIYNITGHNAWFPDEYAGRLGLAIEATTPIEYKPRARLFDYQEAIAKLAIKKKRFALFADCGLGKTLVFLEFAQYAAESLPKHKRVLIVSPLMVVEQTLSEAERFYGDELKIASIPASKLQEWLNGKGKTRIGITNYEAMRKELTKGNLGALIIDESSLLKSHYGKYGAKVIEFGRGLEWKLAGTGTPAPNDRIEFANHAVFLDQVPNVNAFLAKYFVNKGQTQERWVLKPHALRPFYRSLSHWCIFLTNPATYGWKDNTANIPPIHVHTHHVPMTREQEDLVMQRTGQLIATRIGGISNRTNLAMIAKGWYKKRPVKTNKPAFIHDLVSSWPEESTLIWCLYDKEQDTIETVFPDAASLRGSTKFAERRELIDDFKAGRRKQAISKPKIMGFGLNLQIATRQVFSGLQDSYEAFYQCVKRSNRVGSKYPLNVHIPVTDIEEPMIETVLKKAKRVQHDTEEQEAIFKECQNAI
jgi:superfamily II DNA or RNA helicase